MQMRRLPRSIARVPHRADDFTATDELEQSNVRVPEVSEVMEAPLWAEYGDDVAADAQPPLKDHHSRHGSDHRAAGRRKDVDAFVHSGLTPGPIPEGFLVPVARGRALHRN